MNKWMNEYMNEWMNEWISRKNNILQNLNNLPKKGCLYEVEG